MPKNLEKGTPESGDRELKARARGTAIHRGRCTFRYDDQSWRRGQEMTNFGAPYADSAPPKCGLLVAIEDIGEIY